MSIDLSDRRPNSALEIFTLAAVSRGDFRTLYALLQISGLQPGGLQPVIKRLEKLGLLERSVEARRRKRSMQLTEKGERFLEETWRECLVPDREMESILRGTTVAIFMGDIGAARRFLLDASKSRQRRSCYQDPKSTSSTSKTIGFYEHWRGVNECRRLETEEETLRDMWRSLGGSEQEDSGQ